MSADCWRRPRETAGIQLRSTEKPWPTSGSLTTGPRWSAREYVHGSGAAHLVFLALEGDPGLLEVFGRLENEVRSCLCRVCSASPGPRTERGAGEILSGKAEAQGAGEGAR